MSSRVGGFVGTAACCIKNMNEIIVKPTATQASYVLMKQEIRTFSSTAFLDVLDSSFFAAGDATSSLFFLRRNETLIKYDNK
jgi:hypothetical protein